jgi:hypothetical protein
MQLVLANGLLYWVSNDGGMYTSIHWAHLDGTGHQAVRLPFPQTGFGWAIAADTEAVYCLSRAPGTLWKLPFGSSTPQLLFEPDAGPRDGLGLAVQQAPGNLVVWSDEQRVAAIHKDGTGYYDLAGQGAGMGYGPVALSATGVFFVDLNAQSVDRVDIGGKCLGVSECPQIIVGGGQDVVRSPHRMLIDGTHLYWANNSDDIVMGHASRVVRADLGGGALTVLAEIPGSAYDIAVDDQDVYVTIQYGPPGSGAGPNNGTGSIWRTGK